jgi:hypothetical protein
MLHVSYQVSVHFAKRFQMSRFCLEIDQPKTRIAYGGHVFSGTSLNEQSL